MSAIQARQPRENPQTLRNAESDDKCFHLVLGRRHHTKQVVFQQQDSQASFGPRLSARSPGSRKQGFCGAVVVLARSRGCFNQQERGAGGAELGLDQLPWTTTAVGFV